MRRSGHFFFIVIQRDTVELEERILQLASRRCHSRVKWYTLEQFSCVPQVNATAFFDVAEVDCVYSSALVWDHWWFHVSQQSPSNWFEERMILHI